MSKLYFQNCKQLEAGETTPLLKTADMNQNESAKGDRGKGLPSVKTIKLVTIPTTSFTVSLSSKQIIQVYR